MNAITRIRMQEKRDVERRFEGRRRADERDASRRVMVISAEIGSSISCKARGIGATISMNGSAEIVAARRSGIGSFASDDPAGRT